MKDSDTLQRFMFENAAIRGEIVHLDATWQAVLDRHDYPPVVRDLLGEMMAAAALLSSTLKFEGSLTMQVQSGGPLRLLVVECNSEKALRGLARWEGEVPAGSLADMTGGGRLVITIDPRKGRERYQGIVALEGDSIAAALRDYLVRSEQLDTHLWLAADGKEASGMLLQKMPAARPEEDSDAWERAVHLASTIRRDELLELASAEVIHRLFHEEDIRVFDSDPVRFRCSCSRERVANMLRSLGHEEVQSILDQEGSIEVDCEFCNAHYSFDRVDAEQLFAAAPAAPQVPTTRH